MATDDEWKEPYPDIINDTCEWLNDDEEPPNEDADPEVVEEPYTEESAQFSS